jgi:hypothetical protein
MPFLLLGALEAIATTAVEFYVAKKAVDEILD